MVPRKTGNAEWERDAIVAFRSSVAKSDLEAFGAALEKVDRACNWRRAFLACKGLETSHEFRASLLPWWQEIGDSIRSAVNDDLTLIGALRALLPYYNGSAVVIYRGEGFINRCRRTYGLSWSSDRDMARSFAEDRSSRYPDGTVLLSAVAVPDAIICAIPEGAERFAYEMEYIVDRRRLHEVKVLERFPGRGDVSDGSHGSS